MPDVTVKRYEDLESYQGQFLYAGRGLGVTAWGMNVLRLPPDWKTGRSRPGRPRSKAENRPGERRRGDPGPRRHAGEVVQTTHPEEVNSGREEA